MDDTTIRILTNKIQTTMTTSNLIAVNNQEMTTAAFMVAKTNGNINPIMLGAKMAMVAELKKRFANGEIVEFDFIKKSTGEIRHAIGCLYANLVEPQIKGTGVPNSVYGNQTYYDLNKNQFRCFSYETLVRVY
jgi:hypothetical protein